LDRYIFDVALESSWNTKPAFTERQYVSASSASIPFIPKAGENCLFAERMSPSGPGYISAKARRGSFIVRHPLATTWWF